MSRFTTAVELLCQLIAIPSINPSFAADPALAGERRVAHYLADLASRAGLDHAFQNVLPGRQNLIVRVAPRGKVRKRIIVAPHLDTIGIAEPMQLTPQRRGGRVFGRGACDTKGSVAAMFWAVCDFARMGPRPNSTEVMFVGLVDEEDGQAGSRRLASSGLRADLAIVGEPTELHIVSAHKGDIWLQLETTGLAAHGSKPELGRNAIHEMAQVVHFLQTDYAQMLKRRSHPLLGSPTISVGTISGGSQPNIVPDRSVISADRRTIPGETEQSVRRELTALFKKKNFHVRIRNRKTAPCWPMETRAGNPLVTALMRAAGQDRTIGVDYFCDASVLARGGTPSVVFGPGNIAQAHTEKEWISEKSVVRAADILRQFFKSLS